MVDEKGTSGEHERFISGEDEELKHIRKRKLKRVKGEKK